MPFVRRLINSLRSEKLSSEINREVAFHLEERIEELCAEGVPRAEAERMARKQFGNPTFQRERTRDADIVTWLDSLLGDVRYGLRALRRSPVFTLVAILSLALGIGANTAIYTLIDAVVIRSLPVPHPEQIVAIKDGEGDFGVFTNPLWEQIRDRQTALESVAAYGTTQFTLGEGADARRIPGHFVSGEYFHLFGVQPVLGRLLSRADDVRGCEANAVLTYGYWQRELGGRGDVVGSSMLLEGRPFRVVGVTRPGFVSPEVGLDASVYVPICAKASIAGEHNSLDERSNWWLVIMGRRDPRTSVAQVTAHLKTIAPAVYAATVPGWGVKGDQDYMKRSLAAVSAESGVSSVRSRYTKALLVMMGAVGLVLLIACANVANLLLARAAAREREMAIRLAVGAARKRIVRQLLTESTLLAGAGAVLGLFVAHWGTQALVALISTPDLEVALDTALTLRVLLFTAALTTTTAVVFGLVPAWRATRVSPQAAMKAGGRGVADGGHARFTLSKALVVAQVALSLTLLVGSALLIGSLRNLNTVDPGFSTRGVLLVESDFSRAGLPEARVPALRADLLERVRNMPGVRSASTSSVTPISCCSWNDELVVEGFTPKSRDDATAWFNSVSDGYFRTMETKFIAGRDFDATDVITAPTSVIVNASLARKFYGSKSPLGKQFRLSRGDSTSAPYTIVGVVEDAKYRSLRETNSETAYLAATQEVSRANVTLEVRSDADPLLLVPAIKRTVADMSKAAVVRFTPLQTQVARSLQRERVLAILSGLFGAVALALAMLGLYGVMTYTVARRRNEIGVRIALGADRSRVLGMVLGDVARVVAVGLVIGAAGAIASGKLVTSFLFGLTPSDPVVLALAAGVLAVVALAAGLAPALRASRVDPVAALRED